MSSKSKRRVTVDPGNTVSDDAEKRKPSVFERLGPGAGQRIEGRIERKYTDYDSEREREKKCRPFLLTGECPYGATCKYKHVQLSRKSRSREEDASPENLRLKLKGGQSERSSDKRRDSDSEPHDPPPRSSSHSRRDKDSETTGERTERPSRRDKETKIRSQVVVKKSENQDSDDSGDDSDTNWFSTLDYKKELELEQKRQQLQRELSQLAEEEVENITIQKKVPVSPSDSDSSPERSRPSKRIPSPHDKRTAASPHDKRSTSPGGRSKKEKKKHRTKSPPEVPPIRDKKITSPPVSDKPREHKRKHEPEEESHKKHKKKKERKRSLTPPSASIIRAKKKDKWDEPESSTSRTHTDNTSSSRPHSQPHSKHSRSSSSESSSSPPRPKEVKVKAKAKAKKKKSRAGKGDSDSDESHTKSKKWLSPLKKTLKLKKTKASSISGDTKLDEGHLKQRSVSPKAGRRGDRRDLLAEEPVLLSRSHESRRDAEMARSRGRSSEKREKKMKGRQSESPAPQLDRSGSTKRGGDSGRDASFSRKGRQSESPPLSTDRSSGRRGDSSRDLPFDRRKLEQRGERGESRKGGGAEERQKRPPSPPLPPPPRQTEMYSPSQLDRDSTPVREPSQRQQPPASRGRQAERDPPPRDEERRGGPDRDGGRRGEKFEPRSSSSSQDRAGQDRFGRRGGGGDGDSFDQYGQDRGQFDADRNRWEYRDSRGGGQDAGEREPRGRRGDHFERGSSQRDQQRGEGMGRDASFDRADSLRGSGGRDGRDVSRDNEGRDRGRDAPRDRGDNRGRDRDGRGALAEGGKYGSGTSGPDGQRRSGQWEAGSRSGEWGGDRGDPSRDPPAGGRLEERGRMYRDDGREGSDRRGRDMGPEGRQPLDGGRMDRPDSRSDSRDSRLDRGDSRTDRGGDSRMERADSRGERLDRGDSRLDSRGDRGLARGGEGRLDRGDNRMERGGDNPMDHHRGEPPVPPVDQRGFRQGRGMGSGDGRGGSMRGAGSRGSPSENRGGFDRRGDTVGGRPGDRESRMDRDLGGMGQLPPPRDRFLPGPDFRRDEPPGFRDNVPDSGAMRDRRGDDRFIGPDAIDLPPRGDRRFEDVRDDRMSGRGPPSEGRDRMMSHRGGHFDFGRGPGPEVRAPPPPPPPQDLLPNQRRGPLLPTPVEEPRRGDTYDRDPPRMGREGSRDSRSRRDQRDGADFGPQMGRGGRDPSREGMRDTPTWERDSNKDARLSGRDIQRDPSGRRGGGGFAAPGEDFTLPDADRKRRDRERSPRRDGDRTKDSPAQDRKDEPGNGGKDGARGERGDASDARSTRSADDVREIAGQRGGKEGEAAGGGAGVGKVVRDRDSRSDGKRSPDQNQGKGESSLPFSSRRQPVRARSLSPKQRSSKISGGGEAGRSPGRRRSPSRRTGDHSSSPASRSSHGGRSRTPIGTKRKLEEDLRSPRGKDDTKSPLSKRAREDSKSPARKSSRHPSPAGSHHSRGSHSSERRKRPGLMQREPESRFFGSGHDNRDSPARRDRDRERDRDSPAWRDADKDSPARRDRDRERDKESKMEKTSESSKGDSDKTEGSRKRGRSPPRSRGRGSDSSDRGHKRWRGDGSWSEAEGTADSADKDIHKKSSGAEQSKAGEDMGEGGDAGKTPSSNMPPSADAGKSIRAGRGDSFSGRGGEDRSQAEGYPIRGEDSSFPRGPGRSGEAEGRGEPSLPQDGADDSKDASLKNMLYEDDYEKISSDESDFEADDGEKQTQSIVSVLDIDWASLAKQPVPKQTTGSLLKRFHPANVFRQIGVSRALAGQSLFEKIEAICKEGVSAEDGKDNGKDKEKVEPSTEAPQAKGGGKKIDTSLLSDVPVLHMAAVRQKRERANLLRNLGPFRRALCARRDLEIRRQLCKVDKVYEQPAVFPTNVMDTDLCKLSMQLFRQGRDFVERKDSECDSKIELTL